MTDWVHKIVVYQTLIENGYNKRYKYNTSHTSCQMQSTAVKSNTVRYYITHSHYRTRLLLLLW